MAVAIRKVVPVEPHEDLEAQCYRLAAAPSAVEGGVGGLKAVKKIGGEGSGSVVFTAVNITTLHTTTVVKCGSGANLEKEGNVLKMLAKNDAEGVVRQLGMENKEGLWLLELEFLERSTTWQQCIVTNQPCVNPAGETCNEVDGKCSPAGEFFPACRTDWVVETGTPPQPFLDAQFTYAAAQKLIRESVVAFHNLCQAHFVQADGDSGMNMMVTADAQVKLIDLEKGYPLGEWYGSLWCNFDQNFMGKRIEELTRCLAEDDPFRVQATAIGKELSEWKQSSPSQIWREGDQEKIEEAAEAAAKESREFLAGDGTRSRPAEGSILARIDALPTDH